MEIISCASKNNKHPIELSHGNSWTWFYFQITAIIWNSQFRNIITKTYTGNHRNTNKIPRMIIYQHANQESIQSFTSVSIVVNYLVLIRWIALGIWSNIIIIKGNNAMCIVLSLLEIYRFDIKCHQYDIHPI